jgi:competence protein ComGC
MILLILILILILLLRQLPSLISEKSSSRSTAAAG